MIGQTISHYRILSKLGEGGMGIVYVAEDTVLGRQVAIKTLNDGGPGKQHFRTRFLREARAISALSHPHIATIYDYGETSDGQPYIVMELVKGQTLADLINQSKLTLERSIEIIIDVAKALGEAHRHGIVHRDIKPSNIAINDRGQVKVLDFGLAKHLDTASPGNGNPAAPILPNTQTREGVIVGTPMYVSPEQAMGIHVDARSDVFSLGSVLYECIAGQPPFAGFSPIEICAKVIRDDPLPPSAFNSSIPSELDRITLKALAKKAEARYQTADELVADLDTSRIQASGFDKTITRTIKAATSRLPTNTTLSDLLKRPRISIGVVLLSMVFLGTVVWGFALFSRSSPHQPPADAQKWYEIGTNNLREGAYFKAIRPLLQAVEIDDKFALAHARLAEAWSELDYTDRAQRELLRVDGLVPNRAALPQLDSLYLDAIRATLTRDLNGGIKSCEAISKLRPGDGQVFVDLGRAYERNDQLDEAIDSYRTASNLDTQYAAASLRLGTLYARKREVPSANAAFDKADTLFQTLGDLEGRAEVLYQRGVLSREGGQLSDAKDQLQRSLDIARTSGNEYQQIKSMLRLSSVLYLRGTTEQAREMATTAVNLAQSNGIENLATQGLIDLGNTYLVRREYGSAEQAFRQALDIARRNSGRRNEATALLALATLYIQQELKTDEALDYLKQAAKFFEPGGYKKELSQVILFRGRAKLLKGDYDGALQDFEAQLPLAKRINDLSQLASTHTLIGNLLFAREDYPDALRNFDEGYKLYKALDVPLSVGYLILDRSEMLWRLGRDKDAEALLVELPTWVDRIDNNYRQVLLARTALARSGIAFSQGNFGKAKSQAEQSIQLAGKPNNHTAVEAKCILGSILTLSGAKKEPLHASKEAVEMANQVNDQHLLSEALLVRAGALLENDDPKQALAVALHSQDFFARASQQDSEWRAWLIAARASQTLQDNGGAREQLAHANQLLTSLEQKWGRDAFKGYLSRADVQYLREQADRISRELNRL
jgi:serine/threonine protein kinase